ncbi:MAG: protein kinase [Deltaproteobacteria bacterium]
MSDDTVCPAKTRLCRALEGHPRAALALEVEPDREPTTPLFARGELVASRYRILRRLGANAGAELYRARDRELREVIALKAARATSPSAPVVRALFSEARQTRLIRHPNVCRVHDVGIHPAAGSGSSRVYFSTLELIDGWRLARVVAEGPLESPVALGIARQVLAGLQAAHDVNVQHRQLDSSRILVSGPALNPSVRIIEFGLAELTELSSAEERNAGFALDLHDFGLVLLEMLMGRPAASGNATGSPRAPSARISPDVAEVVRRCVSPGPGEAFADVRAVLHSLSS